jgi:hypothetical protein
VREGSERCVSVLVGLGAGRLAVIGVAAFPRERVAAFLCRPSGPLLAWGQLGGEATGVSAVRFGRGAPGSRPARW